MKLFIKIPLIAILFLVISLTTTLSKAQTQREGFLQAYKVLHKGKPYDSSHLRGYILHPYLEYERIKKNIKKTTEM